MTKSVSQLVRWKSLKGEWDIHWVITQNKNKHPSLRGGNTIKEEIIIKKPENVIAHFENNDTSENHELCVKCNGACCRHYSGAYGPWQLFDNPEDITPEAIANLLKKTEEYVLDCYEGYSDEHPDGWFIRPPHKRRVTWETLQLYMNVLGIVYDRIYVDRSFGGECIHFVDGIGCKLSYDKRPVMCQALVAEETCQCAGFDKKDAADWWSEYHHIIDEALELLAQ